MMGRSDRGIIVVIVVNNVVTVVDGDQSAGSCVQWWDLAVSIVVVS